MAKFVPSERDQTFLLPPDMRDWLPGDDLGHFVIAAAERVSLGSFVVNERGSGKAQYHPRMMLALLVYCYANGLFSSRRIERATHRDLGVRFVAANTHPDHDTIAAFRRLNRQAFETAFVQILLLAREVGMTRLGTVSIDGTKIDASTSKLRSVRYDRAQALRDKLRADIAALAEQAEAADAADQAVVDADGSQLVLATHVTRSPSDAPSFADVVLGMADTVGLPERVLADAGFASGHAVEALQKHHVEPLVAIARTQPHRPYDFRPPPDTPKPKRTVSAPWRPAMREKMQTSEARTRYRKRKQTVEPVFGIIKSAMGFRLFSLRGLTKVATEWTLVALAYNWRRMTNLMAYP